MRQNSQNKSISIFDRYRESVDNYLKTFITLTAGDVDPMLSYHFGFKDEKGNGANLQSNGKGLRSTLCLLTFETLGGDFKKALPAAAALELFHNFTLIHDDIQDQDVLRRGKPTVWKIWGTNQAINAGDAAAYLSKISILNLINSGFSPDVVLSASKKLADTGIEVVNGQILDIGFEKKKKVTLEEYMKMISGKTGALIEASITIGALLGNASSKKIKQLEEYGKALGRAFQISDDLLGIWGKTSETGKTTGIDIKGKRQTLPVILAFPNANSEQKKILSKLYSKKADLSNREVDDFIEILNKINIRKKTQELLEKEHKKALKIIEKMELGKFKKDFIEVASALSFRNK